MKRRKQENITPLPGVSLAVQRMGGVPAVARILNVTDSCVRKWLLQTDMSEVHALSVFVLATLAEVRMVELIGEEAIEAKVGKETAERIFKLAERKNGNGKQTASSGPGGEDT